MKTLFVHIFQCSVAYITFIEIFLEICKLFSYVFTFVHPPQYFEIELCFLKFKLLICKSDTFFPVFRRLRGDGGGHLQSWRRARVGEGEGLKGPF